MASVRRLARALTGSGAPAAVAPDARVASHEPGPTDDHEAFVEAVFQRLLRRSPGDETRSVFALRIANGLSREAFVLEVAESAEYANLLVDGIPEPVPGHAALPDLVAERPGLYREVLTTSRRRRLAFVPSGDGDLDWMAGQIADCGYYEQPGVWTLDRDHDKDRCSELVASFAPVRTLELGCSSGAVMAGLLERGIDAWGVDVSSAAKAAAAPDVAPRIHLGSLLDLDLEPGSYDLVYGLDVFEHLTPIDLDAHLARMHALLQPGGWFVGNIPAYGNDPVFGIAGQHVLASWPPDDGTAQRYGELPCDDRGWPEHGHLVWASWAWWQDRLAAAGFTRDLDAGRRLHERFAPEFMAYSQARTALFVCRS